MINADQLTHWHMLALFCLQHEFLVTNYSWLGHFFKHLFCVSFHLWYAMEETIEVELVCIPQYGVTSWPNLARVNLRENAIIRYLILRKAWKEYMIGISTVSIKSIVTKGILCVTFRALNKMYLVLMDGCLWHPMYVFIFIFRYNRLLGLSECHASMSTFQLDNFALEKSQEIMSWSPK